MKDGRITQDGKYNDILKSGSDFMELVGAHKEALSALDSIEAGAAVVGEDSSTGNAKNFLQKKESPTDQNDKTDNAMETNGQLIQAVVTPFRCLVTVPLASMIFWAFLKLEPNWRSNKRTNSWPGSTTRTCRLPSSLSFRPRPSFRPLKSTYSNTISLSRDCPVSFYDLLGIPETGTQLEIKQAYKQLARKYHPDVSPAPPPSPSDPGPLSDH
ncbi:Peptide exporter [Forsythia ovata]|uniref:Peptide exporter n=1 Tax=Forsythia ovata TaxID=205694 RepID=A0ABD1U4S3_9LAMI